MGVLIVSYNTGIQARTVKKKSWREVKAVSMKSQPRFCPKYTQQSNYCEGPRLKASENALRITCQNFREKNEKVHPETIILCLSSYLNLALGSCAHDISLQKMNDAMANMSIASPYSKEYLHRVWASPVERIFRTFVQTLVSIMNNACTYGKGSATQVPNLELEYL